MTAIDLNFKHPTAYMWSTGIQREIPFNFIVDVTYVGRRGVYLQRERDINQALPGTAQANPGVNIAALRPYKGYATIRLAENAAKSITTACRSAPSGDTGTASSSASRIRSGTRRTTRAASATCSSTTTTIRVSGATRASTVGTTLGFSYIYDLPFYKEQQGVVGKIAGGWQITGATFMRSGTPLWVTEGADIAGTGDTFGNPWNVNGDPKASANEQFSAGTFRPELLVRQDGVLAAGSWHVR